MDSQKSVSVSSISFPCMKWALYLQLRKKELSLLYLHTFLALTGKVWCSTCILDWSGSV